MILKEIVLGEDTDAKRKAILENLGKTVILNDFHQEWCHGKLSIDSYDEEVYQMQIEDGRGQKQLHYHDLQQLILVHKYNK